MTNLILTHSMYHTKHLIILAICTAILVVGAIFANKLSLKAVFRILLIVGITSEIIKVFYYINANQATFTYGNGKEVIIGLLPKTDLPFHLCSIQVIFIFILNLSSNDKLKKLVMALMLPTCLVGGIAAILLPTNSSLNGGFLITIQYFGFHVAIVLFSIYLYRSKEVVFDFKDYVHSLLFLAAVGFLAIYINGIVANGVKDINYMYVVHAPNADSLTLPFLNTNHGWIVYITHYSLLAIFVVSLCYIAQIIDKIKSLFNKSKTEENENMTY